MCITATPLVPPYLPKNSFSKFCMGCFNTLFLLLIGGIYFFWPELMAVEGFWFSFIAIWLCFFVSWLLFGDIADEIAGVNKYKDNDNF